MNDVFRLPGVFGALPCVYHSSSLEATWWKVECRRWSAAGARAPRLSVSDFIQRARQVPA